MIHVPWTIKPPCGTPLDMSHPLTQGLVGCWPMNEGAGNIFIDKNKLLLSSNTSWQNNKLTFNGSSSYVYSSVPSVVLKDLTTCTCTFKVNFSSISTSIRAIFSWGNNANNMTCNVRLSGANGGNAPSVGAAYICIRVYHPPTGIDNTIVTTTSLSANTDYIISIVVGSDYKIYVNGVLQSVNVVNGSNNGKFVGHCTTSIPTVMTFGDIYYNGANASYLAGNLSGALFHNRALSPQEIASLYANPYQIFQPISLYNPLYIAAYNYWCKVGGTWEQALDMFVKINGGWEKATDIPKVKVGGVWI